MTSPVPPAPEEGVMVRPTHARVTDAKCWPVVEGYVKPGDVLLVKGWRDDGAAFVTADAVDWTFVLCDGEWEPASKPAVSDDVEALAKVLADANADYCEPRLGCEGKRYGVDLPEHFCEMYRYMATRALATRTDLDAYDALLARLAAAEGALHKCVDALDALSFPNVPSSSDLRMLIIACPGQSETRERAMHMATRLEEAQEKGDEAIDAARAALKRDGEG